MSEILETNDHHRGARYQTVRWLIDARWYYAPIAFVLGWVGQDGTSILMTTMILLGALIPVLFINWTLKIHLERKIQADPHNEEGGSLFYVLQIFLDVVFFFIIMLFTGGGAESVAHSLYFIPIIASMVLFGFSGAIIVSLISGILVILSIVTHAGVFHELAAGTPINLSEELSRGLIVGFIISAIYLFAGFMSGYIAKIIHARDMLLLEQIKKEELHIRRLEELSREFDKSTKLLVRRDLDLTSANEKLTQLDRMKSEIISVVAHQLRTPLSAIKWTLKILLDQDMGPVNDTQKDLIAKGFESNERMITLVNDMLAVDRLESGKLKYNFVPVQFEEVIQHMAEELKTLSDRKHVTVEIRTPLEKTPLIKIDPDKMSDVVQNLLDNAIKYTHAGGKVVIELATEGDSLRMSVKDNGIGIPESEQPKIFSRFFRATNAVREETDGSGLGLFIAQTIVRRHGGTIWFETGQSGTAFHVALPLHA